MKEDEGKLVLEASFLVQTPVLKRLLGRAGFLLGLNRSPLSRFCIETDALGHESGGGFGFIWEASRGDMAAAFSIAGGCSHPHDGGLALLPLPLESTGERELEMQRLSVEHVETRPRA